MARDMLDQPCPLSAEITHHALRKAPPDQGCCFRGIEVLGLVSNAMDGFRTVVHDPDWPYLVGALRS